MDKKNIQIAIDACKRLQKCKTLIISAALDDRMSLLLDDCSLLGLRSGICAYVWDALDYTDPSYRARHNYNKWMKRMYHVMYPVGNNSGIICNPAAAFKNSKPAQMWGKGEYARLRWVFLDRMIKDLEHELSIQP